MAVGSVAVAMPTFKAGVAPRDLTPSYARDVALQPAAQGEIVPHFNGRGQATTTEAKQHISQQKQARAAAARGGKKSTNASDPSKSLPPLGYTVLGPIAAGAFSTILRCRAKQSRAVVAIKSYDNLKCARDVDEADARDRELSVLRLLRDAAEEPGASPHPHIANMLAELGDSEAPHVHIVLEYAEGGSLKRFLETPGLLHPGARDDDAREGMAPHLVAVGMRQLASNPTPSPSPYSLTLLPHPHPHPPASPSPLTSHLSLSPLTSHLSPVTQVCGSWRRPSRTCTPLAHATAT